MNIESSLIVNKDYYETIKDMSNCMICMGIVTVPLQCNKCENLFCKVCVTQLQRNSKECPYRCKNFQFIEPGRLAKNMLGKIIFLCPNGSCDMKIPYEDLLNHNNNCNLPFDCPICKSKVNKKDLNTKPFDDMKIEIEALKKSNNELKKENEVLIKKLKTKINNNSSNNTNNIVNNNNLNSNVNNNNNLNNNLNNNVNNVNNNLYSAFPYQKFQEDFCSHYNANICPIFACCGKAYPCEICHNEQERSHVVSESDIFKGSFFYCKACFTVNEYKRYCNIASYPCNNCNTKFDVKRKGANLLRLISQRSGREYN
jgi:hypothetical protein